MSAEKSADKDSAMSRGAHAVRALLERHGIAKHRHSAFIGEFFALSRAAAHQRISRSTAWTLEELSALGAHFGETLGHVVAPLEDSSPESSLQSFRATLCLGASTIPCRIWLRPDNAAAPGDAFVALRTGNEHLVMPAGSTPDAHALRIARLEVDQKLSPHHRIALWNKNSRAGRKLCAQLENAGLEPYQFSVGSAFLDAARREPFDGYVIDWPIPESDIASVHAALSERRSPSAVVLICPPLRDDPRAVAELAETITSFKAQFLEKPVQAALLVSALSIRVPVV